MNTLARQQELYTVAQESTGATMQANEIYAESLEGRLNALSASWSDLANTLISSEVFKTAISGFASFIEILNKLDFIIVPLANVAIPALITVFAVGLINVLQKTIISANQTGMSFKQLMLSQLGLSASGTGLMGTLKTLKISFDRTTAGALTATGAIQALKLAIGGVMAVTAIISTAVSIFSMLGLSAKGAKKDIAELTSEMKSLREEVSQIESVNDSLQELSDLMDKAKGDPTKNLNNEELGKYKTLIDGIRDTYPEMTSNWSSYSDVVKEDLDIIIEKEQARYDLKLEELRLNAESKRKEIEKAQAEKESAFIKLNVLRKQEKEQKDKIAELEAEILRAKEEGRRTDTNRYGGYDPRTGGEQLLPSLDKELELSENALKRTQEEASKTTTEIGELDNQTEEYLNTLTTLERHGIKVDVDTGSIKSYATLAKEAGINQQKTGDFVDDVNYKLEQQEAIEKRIAKATNDKAQAAEAYTGKMNELDGIVRAQEELAESGELSLSTLTSMASKYPEILMYMGDKNGMKEYLLQLYDIEAEAMQRELDNYLMLRDEELIITEEAFQQKVMMNEDYQRLLAGVNEFLVKNGFEQYQIDNANFGSLVEAKMVMLNNFQRAMAEATDAMRKDAAGLGIEDAITSFKVTSIKAPNRGSLGSGRRPSSSSSSKKPSKGSSSSSSKTMVEDMKLEIDIFYKYNKAIKDVQFSLDKLDKKLKTAVGKERIALMKEQIELYKKLHAEQEKLLVAQELEYNRMVKKLAGEGFQIDSNGTIKNYEDKLKKLESWANQKGISAEEKKARQEKVNEIKKWVDDFTGLVDEMNDTKLDLEDLNGNIKDAQDAIKDYYGELIGVVQDVEGQITDMIKAELEKRKKERLKALEEEQKILEKAKDAYNKANEDEDYADAHSKKRQEILELQSALNIAMKDNSLAGKKRQEQLLAQIEQAKKELEEMEKEQNRKEENDKFDDAIQDLEDKKEEIEKEFEEKYDDKYIASLVAELLGNGFTTLEGDVINISDLMKEHFPDAFTMAGEYLQSEFLDKLSEAQKIAANMADIFKELGVNTAPRGISGGTGLGSAVQQAMKFVLTGETANYLKRGISSSFMGGNRMSVGSLLTVNGNVDNSTLPDLENMVNKAVQKMQDVMKNNYRIGTGRI